MRPAMFITKTLLVETSNGLDDVLFEPLAFARKDGSTVRVPKGGTTDGLSVPRCVQNIIPATGGDWFSGVLHDGGYRRRLEVWREGEWIPANYTREQCDDLLLEALEAQGVSWLKRQTIYRAVRAFGWKAWNDNAEKL